MNHETLDKMFQNFQRHVEFEKKIIRTEHNNIANLMIAFGDRVVDLAERYLRTAIEHLLDKPEAD